MGERVQFHGFVPLEKLASLTAQASLGFSLEEDLGANYRYASPNKVYDYVQAGVPILVSDLPEMRGVVEQYHVGELLAPHQRTPKGLAQRIREIFADKNRYDTYVQNCQLAAQELNWEQEKQTLLTIYQQASI